jgi:SAM-dependent methyltransferase
MIEIVKSIFNVEVNIEENLISINSEDSTSQTQDVFSDKWEDFDQQGNYKDLVDFQKDWFRSLYGFEDEDAFKNFCCSKKIILDAGCGLGYKAAWMAELSPESMVIGIDYSRAAEIASRNYKHLPNLFFFRADISNTYIKEGLVDFVLCDQVIMHTNDPELTFKHLSDITAIGGIFACYVYAKKALPRELLDDYFRSTTHKIDRDEMWEMSKQLTQLGKVLSDLKISIDVPEIPLLGIKGGKQDIQRFIYYNFLKCFYKSDWDIHTCDATNFDWYAPSKAKRYSMEEFMAMVKANKLVVDYLHAEEACFSGRFVK